VEVNIEIQGISEALDEGHGAAPDVPVRVLVSTSRIVLPRRYNPAEQFQSASELR
jgi:hypothetical protein